jgi:hypothetical protein
VCHLDLAISRRRQSPIIRQNKFKQLTRVIVHRQTIHFNNTSIVKLYECPLAGPLFGIPS